MNISKLGYSSSPIACSSGQLRSTRSRNVGVTSHRSPSKLDRPRRLPPTRPTRKICQERLACKGPKCVAVYHCAECGTFQCESCEILLHENPKFLFHDRNQLERPPVDLLCDHICETKNLADVTCESCNKKLCLACDAIIHFQGKAKNHVREPFETEEYLSFSETITVTSESQQEYRSLSPSDKMLSLQSLPDIASSAEESSCITRQPQKKIDTMIHNTLIQTKSFLLIDDKENLKINDESDFVALLGCDPESRVKVISIFGNTGEGKSHTLNNTFYKGFPVFKTSATQNSCTIGVWVAYETTLNVIIVDTEGLLGLTSNHNQRTRLLLKVLAISDVIIYRTRAERLHNDLFTFLGDASRAYVSHFSKELKMCSRSCNFEGALSSLGPAVTIFHETVYTEVLSDDKTKKPEEALKIRFRELDRSIDAFSALEYIGTKTAPDRATSFAGLQEAVKKALLNSSIRSPRKPGVIYRALKALNEKFSGDIDKAAPDTFPMEYFTCHVVCMSCEKKCENCVNHTRDDLPHVCSRKCQYKHQFDNKIFLCKLCFERGEEVVVVPKTTSSNESGWLGLAKYALSGYVLECKNCGVIYRSRQYWYGNEDPTKTAVRVEIRHVWPDNLAGAAQTNQNAAQRVLDSVNYISDAVSNLGAVPTKTIASWMADQVAPTYWKPNYLINECTDCKRKFDPLEKKHHCRGCGEGFCEKCSSKTCPVPDRGWGQTPVRVCDKCFEQRNPSEDTEVSGNVNVDVAVDPSNTVTVRKVTEVIHSALGSVASAIDIPLGLIKDSARPSYWIPDDEIKTCIVCHSDFSLKVPLHHCRACGNGVCDPCSAKRKAVPSRGWDYEVRVCSICAEKPNL